MHRRALESSRVLSGDDLLVQITRAVEKGLICGMSSRMAVEDRPSPCRVAASTRSSELGGVIRLIGLNYRSAGLDVRSRTALAAESMETFLQGMRAIGAKECTVISTCNRTEIYYVGDIEDRVTDLLATYAEMTVDDLQNHLYRKGGICAVCHLFQVAAGLDSAVLGETEIVSQVKQGWTTAAAMKTTGPTTELIFKRALEASKRIRTETDLCRNSTSVGSLAVREAESRAGSLVDMRIMVLGSGQIAERVGKELKAVGATDVTFINRSPERARLLSERLGFKWGPLSEIEPTLLASDVVFATTSAPHPIICQQGVEGLMKMRAGRTLIAVDLGVPPNVEPSVCVHGVELVNMDTLVSKCVMNHERRTAAIPDALNILHEELEKVRIKLTERQGAATIRVLVEHGDSVRSRTLEWALGRMPDLTEKERRTVEDLARRLVLGVLTPPIEALKSGSLSQIEREAIEGLYAGGDEDRP